MSESTGERKVPEPFFVHGDSPEGKLEFLEIRRQTLILMI